MNPHKTAYHIGQPFMEALIPYIKGRSCVFIVDEGCRQAYVENALKTEKVLWVQGGESCKNFHKCMQLAQELLLLSMDRQGIIIAMGGGALLDMAGFLASIYMRGVDFCFVPTTLLAQTDAAIGGKNALNLGQYKNLIGGFSFPLCVVWDTTFLQTLPVERLQEGMAEIIKHAAICDKHLWDKLSELNLRKLQAKPKLLTDIIAANIRIKTRIITQDPYDKGNRQILNFGHTLAHALERHYALTHGVAVAIGMYAACHWSCALVGSDNALPTIMGSMLRLYDFNPQFRYDAEKILPVFAMDKKRAQQQLTLILLKKIGDATPCVLPLNRLPELLKMK